MKRLLMVAFHFPPLAGSSGIQRTLRLVQHLPRHGWQPLVLTAHAMAYERTADDLMADVPQGTVVRRAIALDAQRHLAIAGRYVARTARPDRWTSWRFDAVRIGMQMIEEYRPDALWSTYPLATAHVIGAELQRRSGLPWVADFRDPMAQEAYPPDAITWAQFKCIEERAITQARLSLFTTPSAVQTYRARYASQSSRIHLLENGYDERSFEVAQQRRASGTSDRGAPRVWLHSGVIYPQERDPTQLMAAIRHLHDAGDIEPGQVLMRFRAAGHEDLLRHLARTHGVEQYLEICPPVAYADALAEMMDVDALLVLQAANCNEQIPAKLYEYLRAGRPILCLTDPAGDTAAVLRDAGISHTARLDSAAEIAELLQRQLSGEHSVFLPDQAAVARASRESRSEQFAQWLNRL